MTISIIIQFRAYYYAWLPRIELNMEHQYAPAGARYIYHYIMIIRKNIAYQINSCESCVKTRIIADNLCHGIWLFPNAEPVLVILSRDIVR